MASTYSNSLRLELIATGEAAATWGDKTNANLTNIAAAFGYATQDGFAANADSTTTVADGAADPARAMYFKVTSSATLTATRTLTIAPNTISRVMWIENATTGGQSIQISQGTGANVTVPTGKTAVVYLDGAGSGAAVVDAMAGVSSGASDTLAEILAAGNATGGTDIAVGTGDDITFADSSKAIFGAGDLQIYHNGSRSVITDQGTGPLRISATNLEFKNADDTKLYANATDGGAFNIYYDNAVKLATTATGVDITGTATMDGLNVQNGSNAGITFDLTTNYSPVIKGSQAVSDLYLEAVGGGGFRVSTTDKPRLFIQNNGDISFYEDTGTTAKLFWDASAEALGIGTSSPDNTLMVQGASTDGSASTGNVALFEGPSGTNGLKLFIDDAENAAGLQTIGNDDLLLNPHGGNVGIGTSSPSSTAGWGTLVEVSGTTNAGIKLTETDTANGDFSLGVTAGTFRIWDETASAFRLTLDGSGNVGIGVVPESYQALYRALQVGNTALIGRHSGGTSETYLTANSYYDGAWKYIVSDEASVISQSAGVISFLNAASGTADTQVTFSEAMRLDASGNLLVGKTTPEYSSNAGHVLRNDGLLSAVRSGGNVCNFNRLSSDGEVIQLNKDGVRFGSIGTVAGDIVVGTENTGLRFYDAGRAIQPRHTDGTAANDVISLGMSTNRFKDLHLAGKVHLQYPGNSYYGRVEIDSSTNLIFGAGPNGSEGFRLDSSGNLLVGTTGVPNGTSVYGAGFINTGSSGLVQWLSGTSTTSSVSVARFYNPNGNVGSIQLSGSATTYSTSSDQRLKDNIVDAPSASDDIDAIQVRSFDWKADGSHQKYGMVAQELQTVAPEAVSTPEDPEEMMGVDYSKLVPMMLKEIQSLRARVAQLES